jgi:hypothetical protein
VIPSTSFMMSAFTFAIIPTCVEAIFRMYSHCRVKLYNIDVVSLKRILIT